MLAGIVTVLMLITLYLIISFGFKVKDKFPDMSNTDTRNILMKQIVGGQERQERQERRVENEEEGGRKGKFGFGRRREREGEKGKIRLTRKGRKEGKDEKDGTSSREQEMVNAGRTGGGDSSGTELSNRPVQYMGELWKRERNGGDSAFSKVFVVLESGVLDFYASKKDYLDFVNALNDVEIQVMQFTLEIENLV